MAEFDLGCNPIGGVTIDCSLSTGGIKEVKFKRLPALSVVASTVSITSGVATMTGSALSGWKTWSVVKETASITDNMEKNIQNGSVSFTPHLKIIVNKLRAQIRNEIEVFSANMSVWIAVRDYNDQYWLMGKDGGCDLKTTNIGSGTARLDRSGYELDFEGKEGVPIYSISAATYATLIDA